MKFSCFCCENNFLYLFFFDFLLPEKDLENVEKVKKGRFG